MKLTSEEKIVLDNLDENYEYIKRVDVNTLRAFEHLPDKDIEGLSSNHFAEINPDLFGFIQAGEKSWKIEDLTNDSFLDKCTRAAGTIVYRIKDNKIQVLLAHPGGPFWVNKDLNSWSIIKGEQDFNETPLITAFREFKEETGTELSIECFVRFIDGDYNYKSKKKKYVETFITMCDMDEKTLFSNDCEIEYPKYSGNFISFPENDKYSWFDLETVSDYCMETQKNTINKFKELFTDKY